MATLAILSLVTSTGTNLSLETNKVVYAHNDANSNAVLTYVDNGGRVQVVTLTVSTATLQGYSTGVLFTVSIINTDLSTTTWCLNNGRVIKITPTIGGLCRVVYWNEATSEPIVLNVNASASTVSTNCTQTYPVTDNRTGQLYYINKGFTGNITAETETGLDLSSAIVASRGTAMVAGTTTLTLTGGTKTTNATVLVTNTEVATATKTANGTGYTALDVLTLATGTGTAATIRVDTVTGGAITTFTLLTRGDYTVNPTLTNDAVTGGTGAGATFTLVMGAKTVSVSNAGIYTAAPANPVSTTGGGNNATLTATFSNGTITGAIIKYDGKRNASYETLKVNNTQAALVTAINALS